MACMGGHRLGPFGEDHPHLPVIVFVERCQNRGEMEIAGGGGFDEMKSVPHRELRLSPPIT
jgi:hypothetical protein